MMGAATEAMTGTQHARIVARPTASRRLMTALLLAIGGLALEVVGVFVTGSPVRAHQHESGPCGQGRCIAIPALTKE